VLTLWSGPPRKTAAAAGRGVARCSVFTTFATLRAVLAVVLAVTRHLAALTCSTETTPASTCDWITCRAVGAVAHCAAVHPVASFIAFCTANE